MARIDISSILDYTRGMATEKKVTSKRHHSLSSLKILFKDSWELFKITILLYWKLLVVWVIAFIIVALFAGLLAFPLINSLIGSHGKLFQYLTPYWIATTIIYILLVLVGFAGLIYVGLRFSAAQLLIVKDPNVSVKTLVAQGKPFVKRLFLSSLLSIFFVLGSFMFFILPGIIINFFLMFTNIIIVLEDQPVMAAMKKSYHLVKNNFWPLLGRMVLLQVLIQIFYYLIAKVVPQNGVITLVSFLLNIATSWFFIVYFYTLYKQAKTITTKKESSSLTWMWVLAGIGWVLLIAGVIWLTTFLPHFLQSPDNPFRNLPHKTV